MFDYDDDRNQVRINLANLKNAIDSEKQDTDRLIIDLKAELREKNVEIESLESEINGLIEEKNMWMNIASERVADVYGLLGALGFGLLVAFMSSAWGLI